MDDTLGLLGALAGLLLVAVIVLYSVAFEVVDIRADRACVSRGWPNHTTTYNLTVYCVKRINQTDSVVPLKAMK